MKVGVKMGVKVGAKVGVKVGVKAASTCEMLEPWPPPCPLLKMPKKLLPLRWDTASPWNSERKQEWK